MVASEAYQLAASAGWTVPPERVKAIEPYGNCLKPLNELERVEQIFYRLENELKEDPVDTSRAVREEIP